jgi:hypothetical protein
MAQHDKRAIAAVFETRDDARQAVKQLHERHITHTWFGTASVAEKDGGEETVAIDRPGFFSSNARNLVDALEERGVAPETARALETAIEPGQVILTVEPRDKDDSEVAAILQDAGGELVDELVSRGGRAGDGRTTRRAETFGEEFVDEDLPADYYEEIFYFTTVR